jgi:predicted nucleotidyltransferase
MKIIKNPNDIVTEIVDDYKRVFEDSLLGVVMYGSAVTHEYRPGISDINIVVILKDNSIEHVKKCCQAAKKWRKRNVTTPFFMTPEFIASAVDSYPVEFLDIQTSHRILFGEDFFSHLEIDRSNLRLQCERELRGVSIHLRKAFVESAGKDSAIAAMTTASLKKLLPVFKATLRLNNKPIPKIRSDVIMAIEDLYDLGASALSHLLNLNRQGTKPKQFEELFDRYGKTIDTIIGRVDMYFQEKGKS